MQGKRFLIAVAIVVAAVAYLIYSVTPDTSVYCYTVDEFLSLQEPVGGRKLRVLGRVGDGSVDWNAKEGKLSFTLIGEEDHAKAVSVAYPGIKPAMFAEGREVIVEGRLEPSGVFHADTLMTKCPSKYEAETPEKQPQ